MTGRADGGTNGFNPSAEQPLRILHVITSLARGGAQAHLLELIKGQRSLGHHVELAYLKDAEMVADFVPHVGFPIPLSSSDERSQPTTEGAIATVGRLMAAISATKPDVLHTHLLKADAFGAVCGWLSRAGRRHARPLAIISSKHNDEAPLRRRWISYLHGFLSRADDAVICCSDHVGRYVVSVGRVPAGRIRRIYYGIDLARPIALSPNRLAEVRRELGLPDGAPFVLAVGRLDPQKGWPILLDAMARVIASRDGVRPHLVIVGGPQQGDPQYVDDLLARASDPDLDGYVHFAGVRRDIPDLMAACDLFALASRWEGFGLVFAEAMAAAKPVVATRVSAVPEVVLDGETGLLVEPDDVEGLASAIGRMVSDGALRARMGSAGYRRVQREFGAPRMVRETLATYRDVIATRAR